MKLRRVKQREFFSKKFSKIYHDIHFDNTEAETEKEEKTEAEPQKTDVYLIKCPKCGKMLDRARVVKKKYICYECGGYFRMRVPNRIKW